MSKVGDWWKSSFFSRPSRATTFTKYESSNWGNKFYQLTKPFLYSTRKHKQRTIPSVLNICYNINNINDIVVEVVHMSFQNAFARTGCSPIDTCVTTIQLPAIIIGTFSLFSKCLTVKIQTVIVCIKTHFIDYQYQITNMALVVPAIACGPLFRFSNNCAQHAKDAAQKLCLTDQNIEIVSYFCELHLFPHL